MKNLLNRNIHLVKGKVATWAHYDLPEGTSEEEWGRLGFSGPISHIYHRNPPTGWTNIEGPLRPHAFDTLKLDMADKSRVPFLYNSDVRMSLAKVETEWNWYFRNADADELLFVHTGSGTLETNMGTLTYRVGDYLHLPRGATYRFIPTDKTLLLTIEAFNGPFEMPERGVLGQHAFIDPAVIVYPELPDKEFEKRDWQVRILRDSQTTVFTYPFNPCDIIGWKGDLAPWKLNVDHICPIVSDKMHLPPPVHTTVMAPGFIVCSFLPRPMENFPKALKVPFYHSNIDYDEVLFYHNGNFFSRHGIDVGMVTWHPAGFPHGPHPKAAKAAESKTETNESAVMLDTRRPLKMTEEAKSVEWADYWKSWMDK